MSATVNWPKEIFCFQFLLSFHSKLHFDLFI